MFYEWVPVLVEICQRSLLDLGIVTITVFMAISYFMFAWVGYWFSKILLHSAELASRSQITTITFAIVMALGFLVLADIAVGIFTDSQDLFILEVIYDFVRDPSGYQDSINSSLQFIGP
jgi:hypothetical protein